MDSKERHEMRTNELADWLGHVPDFLNKYRNQLIGAALIIVGLISWPILNRWRQGSDFAIKSQISGMLDTLETNRALAIRQQQPDAPQEISAGSFMVSANNLADEAKKAPSDNLAALALIKRAQALRMDLIYRKDIPAEDVIAAQNKQAQEAYQQAYDKAQMPALKAMAQFGLGLCTEESGMLDQAKSIYQKIVDEPTFAGTSLPRAAQDRIDKMADNNKKYVFVETPKVEPAPVDVPQPVQPAVNPQVNAPAPQTPAAEQPAN